MLLRYLTLIIARIFGESGRRSDDIECVSWMYHCCLSETPAAEIEIRASETLVSDTVDYLDALIALEVVN